MDYTRPVFDMKDQEHLDKAIAGRKQKRHILGRLLVGDVVIMPDGQHMRFSHAWQKNIQTATGGSFFLYGDGDAEFSGTLNPGIPKDRLVDTGGEISARFWFFHHNEAKAHNGVYFSVMVPIYRYVPEDQTLRQ
jgi:hypothetical protein